MNPTRYLRTITPDGGLEWECTLGVAPDAIPHYSHNSHLPVFFYGGWASSFAPYRFRALMLIELAREMGESAESTNAAIYPTYWQTREHWFQAHKTDDLRVVEAIAKADDTWDAKALGNSRNLFTIREDWDIGYSYEVMLEGIRIQLAAHEGLRDSLIGTGTRFIAEVSPRDALWGIYDRDRETWDGKNWLGAAWMQARSEVTAEL